MHKRFIAFISFISVIIILLGGCGIGKTKNGESSLSDTDTTSTKRGSVSGYTDRPKDTTTRETSSTNDPNITGYSDDDPEGTGGKDPDSNGATPGNKSPGQKDKPGGNQPGDANAGQKKDDTPTPESLPPAKVYVKSPQASGSQVHAYGDVTLDYSNASQGYVMIKYSGDGSSAMKVQIAGPATAAQNYDIKADGNYVTFPLHDGNGSYKIMVLRHNEGNRYTPIFDETISVSMPDPKTAFLYPSKRVPFSSGSSAVSLSGELTRGKNSDLEKIEAIYTYIVQNIKYDNQKASSVAASGQRYETNPDATLRVKSGICGDYATLMAAMLRVQNIPVKVIEGNVSVGGGGRHAWNLVYTQEKGWIAFNINISGGWKLMDSTFGTVYGNEIDNYAKSGNYTQDLIY